VIGHIKCAESIYFSSQAYCQSLQICPSHAKSWLSWGHLCFSLAEITERQDSSSSTSGADPSKSSSVDKKAIQYYSQSMGCYFEAIRCGSHNWTLISIPRCLWLLRKDARSPGLLCQTFEMRSKLLPEWVWLPWTPQLLSSLGRNEAVTISKILKTLLARYPQSIYFGLRAYYLERRDVERAHKSAGSSAHQDVPSVRNAEDIMSSLRRAQPQLWLSLEAILEELIIRFRPSLEEELLSTINALILRGLNQLESTKGGDLVDYGKSDDRNSEVANFHKTLEKIAAKCFRSPTTEGSEGGNMNCGWDKSIDFSARYKASFERDFLLPEADAAHRLHTPKDSERLDSSFPLTLEDIVRQLQKWQRILEHSIVSVSSYVALHNLSPLLTVFSCEPPDMWEGACDPHLSSEHIVSSDHLIMPTSPSTSAVAAMAAASAASSSVAANAASEGVGGYFGGGSTSVEIPGQYAPYHAIDSRPQPELHAKLIRFEPTVEILKLPDDRQLVRRITMMG
jgi:transformation/transcription domain-associated protein